MRSRIDQNGNIELELQVNEVKELGRAMDFVENPIASELFDIHSDAKAFEKEVKEKRRFRKNKESEVIKKLQSLKWGQRACPEKLTDEELENINTILIKMGL